jgi:hypothetical protein
MDNNYRIEGNLSYFEWLELCALDYVLTWNYTDNYERDENRLLFLRNKRWEVANG